MRITHLVHSCMLVEAAGLRVLVDPGAFSPAAGEQADIDLVLVTHQHPDHVDPEALAAVIRRSPEAVVGAEPEAAAQIAAVVAEAGGRPVVELAAGSTYEHPPRRSGSAADGAGEAPALTVRALGGRHAVIHPDIPRVGNVGFVLDADDEPHLGITGDSLEPIDEFVGIDVLAFAVTAPWSKMAETIDFLRAVRPRIALPVHDGVASPEGRAIYMRQSTALAPEGTEVRDWPEDRVIEV